MPDKGDHFIVVVGPPVEKDHGIRPETIDFPAKQNSLLLDLYDGPGTNVILLKLTLDAKQEFHKFNGISMNGREINFHSSCIIS